MKKPEITQSEEVKEAIKLLDAYVQRLEQEIKQSLAYVKRAREQIKQLQFIKKLLSKG